jgi:predicted DNA-binding protein
MTDSQQTINRREPKGSLGQLKMQSYKMPLQLIDKINRLAEAREVTKAQIVRGAVEGLDEGAQ